MDTNEQLLAFAAHRVSSDPAFLAYYLVRFQGDQGWTADELQADLRCVGEAYYRLALCRTPDLDSRDAGSRLLRIADYAGADPYRLIAMVRHVRAMDRLRPTENVDRRGGFLLAARDREEDEPEPPAMEPDEDDDDESRS